MEDDSQTLNPKLCAESALLVETLERRHRRKQMDDFNDNKNKYMNWVASRDFTVEVGKKEIEDYILTWELQLWWNYSLDFLCSTEKENHTFYHYRARFCTQCPWRLRHSTASVYFTVGLSKAKPGTLPVEVLFTVESNRLVHTPGRTRFHEQWLINIMECKTLTWRLANC